MLGVLIAFTVSTTAVRADDVAGSLDVGGVHRTYLLHVPATLGASVPLVLSFHGHGGTADRQAALTGFDALSDRYGFIVVYPQGINDSWNDGRPENAGSDDVAFVRALIADLSRRYPIDPKRIDASGFSNGATFAQYLGCEMADRIAAIAPVSGYLATVVVSGCKPARPISVLEIGGTLDPIEPYRGLRVHIGTEDRGTVLSAEATVERWAMNASCAPTPIVASPPPIAPPDATTITTTTYVDCAAGTSVVLDTVNGAGHTWPGTSLNFPALFVGLTTHQLDASQAIVDFFYAHPMR